MYCGPAGAGVECAVVAEYSAEELADDFEDEKRMESTPPLNLPHCSNTVYYSVLQRSQLRSTTCSSDVVNHDLNPVLPEIGIVHVASGKSRSYSGFAFSCSRTPVTRTFFFCCCQKHGDVQAFG